MTFVSESQASEMSLWPVNSLGTVINANFNFFQVEIVSTLEGSNWPL